MASNRGLTRHRTLLLCSSAFVFLASCDLAPDLQKPESDLPAHWALSETGNAVDLAKWWTAYGDPALNAEIEHALSANADLQMAYARVAESRARASGTQAQQYPTLNAMGTAVQGRSNGNVVSDLGPGTGSNTLSFDQYSIGPILSFEIDLWGRLANATQSARERMLADEADARAVRLAVVAETAGDYFAIAALNEQIGLVRKLIASWDTTLDLQRQRYKEGDIDKGALSQAESGLASAKAKLPPLEDQRQRRLNALAALQGATPRAIVEGNNSDDMAQIRLRQAPPLPELAPEQVVANRPDIMRADHLLVASNAEIGVARAAYLPRLSLSALFGYQTLDVNNLLHVSSQAGAGVAQLSGPLLDFGRARAQVEVAEAKQKQAYIHYEQTVRVAFREIMDAVEGYKKTDERRKAKQGQEAALANALTQAQRRFGTGYASNLDVQDAERAVLELQVEQADIERAHLQTTVDLYKALGGG